MPYMNSLKISCSYNILPQCLGTLSERGTSLHKVPDAYSKRQSIYHVFKIKIRDDTQRSEDTGRCCDFKVTQKAWNRDLHSLEKTHVRSQPPKLSIFLLLRDFSKSEMGSTRNPKRKYLTLAKKHFQFLRSA